MPIERGQDWGWEATDASPERVCESDAELAAAIAVGVPLVRVVDGDIARTLGLARRRSSEPATWHVPLDALRMWLDDREPIVAAAHIRIGSWSSRGTRYAIMNAAFVGNQNLAPRAHPGDGFADVVTSALTGADRFKAWRRASTGTHVPHPDISIRRSRDETLHFDSPRRIHVDGHASARATRVRVEVVPRAIVVAL